SLAQEVELILRSASGTKLFAVILNQQRAKEMCVPSENFALLSELMETALSEAEMVGDFKTGKILMHMAATYYRNVGQVHEFVQNRLKHISIWRNLHFWSETLSGTLLLVIHMIIPLPYLFVGIFLLDAIKTERNKIISIEKFRGLSKEEQEEYVERERNIAFATIGAFAHSMLSLKVPHKEVRSFIHKWCMFYSLDSALIEQLMNNFNSLVVSLADDEKETTKKLQKEAWLEIKRESTNMITRSRSADSVPPLDSYQSPLYPLPSFLIQDDDEDMLITANNNNNNNTNATGDTTLPTSFPSPQDSPTKSSNSNNNNNNDSNMSNSDPQQVSPSSPRDNKNNSTKPKVSPRQSPANQNNNNSTPQQKRQDMKEWFPSFLKRYIPVDITDIFDYTTPHKTRSTRSRHKRAPMKSNQTKLSNNHTPTSTEQQENDYNNNNNNNDDYDADEDYYPSTSTNTTTNSPGIYAHNTLPSRIRRNASTNDIGGNDLNSGNMNNNNTTTPLLSPANSSSTSTATATIRITAKQQQHKPMAKSPLRMRASTDSDPRISPKSPSRSPSTTNSSSNNNNRPIPAPTIYDEWRQQLQA
ncbi:hypothetical protein HMI54_009413, partial [Coelomomyces lativittatus]